MYAPCSTPLAPCMTRTNAVVGHSSASPVGQSSHRRRKRTHPHFELMLAAEGPPEKALQVCLGNVASLARIYLVRFKCCLSLVHGYDRKTSKLDGGIVFKGENW